MSAVKVNLNDSTLKRINELYKKDKKSVEQFVELAVLEKISAMNAVEYLEKRGKKGNKMIFHKILTKAPDRPPFDFDKE